MARCRADGRITQIWGSSEPHGQTKARVCVTALHGKALHKCRKTHRCKCCGTERRRPQHDGQAAPEVLLARRRHHEHHCVIGKLKVESYTPRSSYGGIEEAKVSSGVSAGQGTMRCANG